MSGEVVEQLTIFSADAKPSWSHIYRRQRGGNTCDDDDVEGDDDTGIHFHTLGYHSDIFIVFHCFPCWYWNTTDVFENTFLCLCGSIVVTSNVKRLR